MTKSYLTKILVVLFCILVLVIILTVSLSPKGERYPLIGRVFAIDSVHDTVFFVDGAGVSWSFKGVEDWCNGDEIVSIRYGGLFETP